VSSLTYRNFCPYHPVLCRTVSGPARRMLS
jgi:hypothetical protein